MLKNTYLVVISILTVTKMTFSGKNDKDGIDWRENRSTFYFTILFLMSDMIHKTSMTLFKFLIKNVKKARCKDGSQRHITGSTSQYCTEPFVTPHYGLLFNQSSVFNLIPQHLCTLAFEQYIKDGNTDPHQTSRNCESCGVLYKTQHVHAGSGMCKGLGLH